MRMPWLDQTARHVVPPVGAGAIRWIGRCLDLQTWGYEAVDQFHQQRQPIIIAFWHGRQLMMPLAYRGRSAYVLISQHRDGELIHRIVSRFGFRSVRGSTTRGGREALRTLIRHGRAGADLVVTPDGPKGPCEQVQDGIVYLAKVTGFPILPLTFACSKKKSSPAGIASKCPILADEGCLSGVRPCGSTGTFPGARCVNGATTCARRSSRSLSKRSATSRRDLRERWAVRSPAVSVRA